ncbi:neuralized PATS1 [Brachionus plicatilis]|uniref:Neuralized PATS1 n=1 Tax=Brachionus plicatilis TaxID=10195 RepID=A0A3M7PAQ0_BRAPC|nr:neuralized PATS1 [Brachionus plicatilis]
MFLSMEQSCLKVTSLKSSPSPDFFFVFLKYTGDQKTEILFHRIITRTARWTLMKNGSDVNKSVKLYSNTARFYLDEKHDFVIELAPIKYARIKIQIIRIDDEESEHALPVPNSCAKVRNFMETVLIDLKNMWVKRLKFNACVQCHCGKMCHLHQQKLCSHNECIHFLNLDECLTNNIVNCDYRRVKTLIYQSWFPIQNISFNKMR